MSEKYKPTSIRFTHETHDLIKALGLKLGISKTAVLSLAVRRLAEIEKVELSPQKQNADQDQ